MRKEWHWNAVGSCCPRSTILGTRVSRYCISISCAVHDLLLKHKGPEVNMNKVSLETNMYKAIAKCPLCLIRSCQESGCWSQTHQHWFTVILIAVSRNYMWGMTFIGRWFISAAEAEHQSDRAINFRASSSHDGMDHGSGVNWYIFIRIVPVGQGNEAIWIIKIMTYIFFMTSGTICINQCLLISKLMMLDAQVLSALQC